MKGMDNFMRKEIIQKANLKYSGINRISEAGLPIGNGRMGTLLWLTGDSIHMQINRCDVFANDGHSRSFALADTDFAHGCAFLDINFPGWGPVFDSETQQELNIYNGEAVIEGKDITVRFQFDMDKDILCVQIDDRRVNAPSSEIHLRTLRGGSQYIPGARPQHHPSLRPNRMSSYIVTGKHLSESQLSLEESFPSLRQIFTEGDFKCESEVALAIFGKKVQSFFPHFTEIISRTEPGSGEYNIFISSSSSFSDSAQDCSSLLNNALSEKTEEIKSRASLWWEQFWKQVPFIAMNSDDGKADRIARDVIYFQYLMACVSRGKFAARFGGLLFMTGGDYRMWGAQFWWHNQSCYYNALVALGMFDLAKAQLEQIWNNRDNYRLAAKQQWGAEGMWIPETVWFNGPVPMDDELADEMRSLYTLEKPWEEHSDNFMQAAVGRNTFESRWNWIEHEKDEFCDRGYGPFGYVVHIFSTTAKVAWLFWQQFCLSMDTKWLADRAYPIIRDTAELYRTLPQLQKGPDGKLHLYHVNNHEPNWDCTDSISEMAAMHGILPIAIRAAEYLDTDLDLREKWGQILSELAPLVTNKTPGAVGGYKEGDPEIWACACEPCKRGKASFYHGDPLCFYDLTTLETPVSDPDISGNSYRHMLALRWGEKEKPTVRVLDKICTIAARQGDKSVFPDLMISQLSVEDPDNDFCDPSGTAHTGVLDNRLTLREGPQAIGAQRLGRVAEGLVHALCSSVPAAPGGKDILHLFAAVPENWNIDFDLPARGGLWIHGIQKNGQIQSVTLKASQSGVFAVKNPWNGIVEEISLAAGEEKNLLK